MGSSKALLALRPQVLWHRWGCSRCGHSRRPLLLSPQRSCLIYYDMAAPSFRTQGTFLSLANQVLHTLILKTLLSTYDVDFEFFLLFLQAAMHLLGLLLAMVAFEGLSVRFSGDRMLRMLPVAFLFVCASASTVFALKYLPLHAFALLRCVMVLVVGLGEWVLLKTPLSEPALDGMSVVLLGAVVGTLSTGPWLSFAGLVWGVLSGFYTGGLTLCQAVAVPSAGDPLGAAVVANVYVSVLSGPVFLALSYGFGEFEALGRWHAVAAAPAFRPSLLACCAFACVVNSTGTWCALQHRPAVYGLLVAASGAGLVLLGAVLIVQPALHFRVCAGVLISSSALLVHRGAAGGARARRRSIERAGAGAAPLSLASVASCVALLVVFCWRVAASVQPSSIADVCDPPLVGYVPAPPGGARAAAAAATRAGDAAAAPAPAAYEGLKDAFGMLDGEGPPPADPEGSAAEPPGGRRLQGRADFNDTDALGVGDGPGVAAAEAPETWCKNLSVLAVLLSVAMCLCAGLFLYYLW